ncbi:MAG: hypothetical protein Q9208_003900 [Pyrenodesmia sp. 3 TL-2023]
MHLITFFPLSLTLTLADWISPAAASTTTIRAHIPTCWPDTTRFHPITFRDCISVINTDITHTHTPHHQYDPDLPLKFSDDPTLHPDIQLPRYWKRVGVNCGVGLDFAPTLRGYDRTTLRDIKAAAMAVAVECVIKPPHVGGYVRVGWYDKLGVLISGGRKLVGVENGTGLER